MWDKLKKVVVGFLVLLALLVIYNVVSFVFSDGWASWSMGKMLSLFVWMLKTVFFATILYLVLPIIIYLLLETTIQNPILKVAAGVGCIYIFWWVSGTPSFSWSLLNPLELFAAAMKLVKLAFQTYFLTILVMPQEVMTIIGVIASLIGTVVIYIFPDAPGAFDDIAAIGTLITVVFVYLNTFATLIKRQVGERIRNRHFSHDD